MSFKPTRIRDRSDEDAKPSARPARARNPNPLHQVLAMPTEENAAPALSALIHREWGTPAARYEAACLAAFRGAEIPALPLDTVDQLSDTLAAGTPLRRLTLRALTLDETDVDVAFLLLRHLLDTHLSLSTVGNVLAKSEEVEAMRNTLSECRNLQTVLRAREANALSSRALSLRLVLNHLALGAVVLNVKKIEQKLGGLAAPVSIATVLNPIIKKDARQSLASASLLGLLSQAALDDLQLQPIAPPLIHKLNTPGWMKEALGPAFKAEDLGSVSLMEVVIQHTESLRRTRKEPVEISVMQTLGYLLAGLAAALFLKVKIPSPFSPAVVNNPDTEGFFNPLQAALASATAAPSANSTTSSSLLTASSLSSPLPSVSISPSPSGTSSLSATPSAPNCHSALGDFWVETLGGAGADYGESLAVAPDGSLLLTGYTTSFGAGGQDVFLAKFYSNGSLAWAQTLGGAGNDEGNSLVIAPDGSLVLTGLTTSFGAGSYDVLLAKFQSNGNLAWVQTLGGTGSDQGYGLAIAPDGSLLLTGLTTSFGAGNDDVFLAKFQANGSLAWAQTLGGVRDDYGVSLAIGPDDSLLLTGTTASFGSGNFDVLIAKFQPNGSLAWIQTLGGTNIDYGISLGAAQDGSLWLTGYTNSFGAQNDDMLLTKFQSNGSLAWAQTLGGRGTDYALSLAVAPDGSLVLTGSTTSFGAGGQDVFLAKFCSNGSLAWAQTLGGAGNDEGNSLVIAPDGSLVLTGFTNSFSAGNYNVLLAQLNSQGELPFSNALIQSISNAQVQFINPAVSDITHNISLALWGVQPRNWTSVSVSSINPVLQNLNCISASATASMTPSFTPSAFATLSLSASLSATPTAMAITDLHNSWVLASGGTLDNEGYATAITPEGNIVVTGFTNSSGAGGLDVLVAQYYANGTFAWAKTLGGASTDEGQALALSPEGNIIVAGYTDSFGAGSNDVLVAQYYPNGTFAWAKTLGGTNNDYGQALALGPEGNIVVAGYTASFGAGGDDLLVAQWTTNGTFAWAKTWGGTSADLGYALALSPEGNIVVAGFTGSFGAGLYDVLVAQWTTNGTFAWAKTLGGSNYDQGRALTLSPEGNIVITGWTESFGAGGADVLVAQYYANGTFAWAKTLGGASEDVGQALPLLSPDGNIVVAGYTASFGAGNYDVLVAQYYANGTFAWTKTLGGTSNDEGHALALSPEGSIVLSGWTKSFGAGAPLDPSLLVAELNTTGSLTFNHSFLLQSILSIQDQSWNPSLSNITTASVSSCLGIINKSWTSVNTSSIHPNLTLLYPDPSPTPSTSLTPSHSGSPARRRLEVYENSPLASESSRIPVKSSSSSSYDSTSTTIASLAGLGFILLLLWRFVHAHNACGLHRKKHPVKLPKRPFFPEKTSSEGVDACSDPIYTSKTRRFIFP